MIDPLTARIERPGPIAPRSALAKLTAALLICLLYTSDAADE